MLSFILCMLVDSAEVSLPPLDSLKCSVACDGQYFFVYCTSGLFKIGTGYHNTELGKIYTRNRTFHTNVPDVSGEGMKCDLAVCDGKLYFRSPTIEHVLLEIDMLNLEVCWKFLRALERFCRWCTELTLNSLGIVLFDIQCIFGLERNVGGVGSKNAPTLLRSYSIELCGWLPFQKIAKIQTLCWFLADIYWCFSLASYLIKYCF